MAAFRKQSGRKSPLGAPASKGRSRAYLSPEPVTSSLEIASTELARKINRDNILRLIRGMQPIARADLARSSGLQSSTVSSLVDQLLAEGWVKEGEALKTARGRRPTHISLNDQLSMLVADVRPGRATVGAVDLNGDVLETREITMPLDVEAGVQTLGLAMEEVRKQFQDRRFEGAGVCLPGRVDVASGRLMVAPNLRWRDFDIREALSSMLGMPVEMENDANACLLSVLWFGHLDCVRDAVLLAISEGVGASILADGYLVSGRLGMAGEFGHICVDPRGPLCNCGRTGCWELVASSQAALEDYRRSTKAPLISYEELCRLAASGVLQAVHAIEKQAHAIGKGLRMVTATLEPEVILFAGEVALAWAIVEPILQSECKKNLLVGRSPKILRAEDNGQAHIRGAAAVVLQRHSGYYRSRPLQVERAPSDRSSSGATRLSRR